jgi:hypothetical protein
LLDRSSRRTQSPRDRRIEGDDHGKKRMTHGRIAQYLSVSTALVNRVLARARFARLTNLEPAEPAQRDEHEKPRNLSTSTRKTWGAFEKTTHRPLAAATTACAPPIGNRSSSPLMTTPA